MEPKTHQGKEGRVGRRVQPSPSPRAGPNLSPPARPTATVNVRWIVTIVFVAAVMQSLTGFGFALVVMPLVTLIVDLRTAAPLIALAGLTAYTVNLVRFRGSVNLGEVARLGIASALGLSLIHI